jgi:DNA-binding NtrC family response regulator
VIDYGITPREGPAMIIATSTAELGLRVGLSIESGRKFYVFTIDKALEMVGGSIKPAVVVLDAKLGGSQFRAVEFVPRILQIAPLCKIVLLTYDPSRAEVAEAMDKGTFGTVDMTDDRWRARLEQIICSAWRHRRADAEALRRNLLRH